MKLIFVLTFLFLGYFSFAQQLSFNNFSVADGLAQSQVYAIESSIKGELILATQGGGISIYDGEKFLTLNKRNNLSSNNIYCLLRTADTLLVGTEVGVDILINNQVVTSIKSNYQISAILKINKQTLIGTEGGLFEIKNQELVPHNNSQLKNKYITGCFSDYKNQHWITTTKGIYNLNDPFKSITTKNGLKSNYITHVSQSKNNIYLSTFGTGLIILDKKLNYVEVPELLKTGIFNSTYLDSRENLWIGSQNSGAFLYSNKKVEQFSTAQGIANNNIKCFKEDLWGNIWIGTSGGGISKYSETDFEHYNTYSGLNGDYIYDVKVENGNIWTSTTNGGIVKLNDSLNKNFAKENNRKIGKVRNLLIGSNNTIWFTEEGKGLGVIYERKMKEDTIIFFNNKANRASNWVLDMAKAKGGSIWLATANEGLIQVKPYYDSIPKAKFIKYKSINNSISPRVELVSVGLDNSLWFVDSKKGLAKFEGRQVQFISETKDLDIRCIAFLKNSILLGTSSGLYISNGKSIEKYKDNDVLTSENIYQLQVENDTTIWLGTEQGLDRINSVFNNPEVQHFGSKEGFRGVETSIQASYKDDANNLWFGTVRGLEKYTPKNYSKKAQAPILYLDDIKIAYESLNKTEFKNLIKSSINAVDSLVLPYYKTQLELELKSYDLSGSDKVLYSYFLSGFDKRWSPPTERSNIVFTNIPPGSYKLFFKAGNDRVWTNQRTISIEITPPYYTTFWFISVCILAFIAIVATIIYLSMRRLRKKNEALKEKISVERSLVELEQKALRLQMNPHFIFNVLQSIQEQIILDDKSKARLSIAKFAKLMREILENSREKFISLDQEIETVVNYLKLEQLTKTIDFSYSIDIDEDFDSEESVIPPLLIQPFVENAIIHGFKTIDRKPHISIQVILESEDMLLIIIDDNGCGRQKSQTSQAQVDHLHKSLALQVTQERLSQLNQKNDTKKLFEIIDKFEGGNAVGTTVKLRLGI